MWTCATVIALAATAAFGAWAAWRGCRRLYPRPLALVAAIGPWLAIGLLAVATAITRSPLGFAVVTVIGVLSVVFDRHLFYLGGGPRDPESLHECVAILKALVGQRRITKQDRQRIDTLVVGIERWRSPATAELIDLVQDLVRYYIHDAPEPAGGAEYAQRRIWELLKAQPTSESADSGEVI